jgi:hypothetical protein
MFALIISIIAIALVVALAGATLYYGGDAFSKGSARSTAAALVNQGQQISGAWTLYKADHGGSAPVATDLATVRTALVGGQYLAALPTPATSTGDLPVDWTFTAVGADPVANPATVAVLASTEVCAEVIKLPGNSASGIFSCDVATKQFSYVLR